jgi:PEP-CTERM motif
MRVRALARGLGVLVLGLWLVGPSGAKADSILFQITAGNTAISPYSGPYADVTVNRTSSTTATITFSSNTVGLYTYLFGNGGSVDVNVNASSWTLGSFSGSNSGTGFSPGPFSDGGSGNIDSFGIFNQTVNSFDGYMHSSSLVSFVITNTSGTWASASDVLTPNSQGSVAAAHIFVCGPGTCDAGTPALATGFAAVPEPSTLALVVLGGSLLGVRQRRPRSRQGTPR